MAIRIVDVTDTETFGLVPPCADPGFDHRTCDYWEDADRGSKAARSSWLEAAAPPPVAKPRAANPFASDDDEPAFNPFAPAPRSRPAVEAGALPKLRLLARGAGVAGSYAKVLVADGESAAYAQFGPLSAYPRAQRTRELYPKLPDAPLPAVITCIATTREARERGLAAMLVEAVCDDLAGRGFAAVEAYPEVGARPDATSAATPAFWEGLGFTVAAPDDRFPVLRRELA